MLSKTLIILLVAGAFARPDVSHLKINKQQPSTSYDVPVSSVNSNYVSSSHTFRKEQEVPNVNYLPPFVLQQGAVHGGNSASLSNVASGSGLVGISHAQGGGSLPGVQQVHFVSGQGQVPTAVYGGGSSSGNQHFISNLGQNQGNVQYVSQIGQGQGQGQGNVQYVSQVGQGGISFVSQGSHGQIGVGHGTGATYGTNLVKNQERVYYFSAPDELEHHARLRINIVPTHTKNTNVIFVKTPSTGKIIPEVVVPPHQIVEDKTKVVVLVKDNEQYVPITVPAPIPISQGKAEVLVVKYHDKNDAARVVSSGGNAVGTTLVQHNDKPSFINTIGNVQYGNVGTLSSRFNSGDAKIDGFSVASGLSNTNADIKLQDNSKSSSGVVQNAGSGAHSVQILNESPKTETYVTKTDYVSATKGVDKQSTVDGNLKIVTLNSGSGNVENAKTEYQLVNSIPSLENVNVVQNLQGGAIKSNAEAQYANIGNTGGSYEIKTVGITENSPAYHFQNVGGQFVNNANQQSLGTRFSGDGSGLSQQSGYTIKTTEVVQNGPQGQYLDSGSLDNLHKLLGGGIEIVGISKGVLESSGVGSNAQDSILKSLGISGESSLNYGGVSQGVSGIELKQGRSGEGSLFKSSSTEGILGTNQIKIGNDVADIISGPSLNL